MLELITLKNGERGLVRALHGGRHFIGRLAALGFTPGVQLTMVRNNGFGPVIISVRGSQVALGWRQAQRVIITPSSNGEGA
ncbi:MAG: FeoA family protein [Chloroflexota bacterium]|nr:FeoA family protein [Chloroflexota bacterium]